MLLEQTDTVSTESACRALILAPIPVEDLGRAIVADVQEGDQAKDRADQPETEPTKCTGRPDFNSLRLELASRTSPPFSVTTALTSAAVVPTN
jgi:hypothetical protein